MRSTRSGGLLLALLLVGFSCDGPNPHPPDALLRDSLGLTLDDRVHRVGIERVNGSERITPRRVRIRPGDHVSFETRDRYVHTVSFVLDSLSADQRAWLRSTDQDRSPPLLRLDARFVVRFGGDAPPGSYPFLVEGNGRPGRGAVVLVTEPG